MKFRAVLILMLFTAQLQAAVFTSGSTLRFLPIGGDLYHATVHPGMTFAQLWDSNDDGIFGNDLSVFNAAPTFLGNQALAAEAADQVIAVYGALHGWSPTNDSIAVPWNHILGFGFIIETQVDNQTAYAADDVPSILNAAGSLAVPNLGNTAYVSFEFVVPGPPVLALLGLGMLLFYRQYQRS